MCCFDCLLTFVVCYIHGLDFFSDYDRDDVILSIGQYYEEFTSAIVKFYESCSNHSVEGEGIVDEVDETKMGKRKYNKGHRVEGLLFDFLSLFVCV